MKKPLEEESFIKKLNQHLTIADRREKDHLQKETSRVWRNFWIRIAHKHGYSNTEIAYQMDLAESTVRYILKGNDNRK